MFDKEKNRPEIPIINEIPREEPRSSRPKLIPSFIAGLQDFAHGESYATIFNYFWPELISAMMLTSFLPLIDSFWIADLKSTSTYATLNVTNNFIHFMKKVAEGLAIGSIVLCGQYNGTREYKEAGRTLKDIFWVTVIVGGVLSGTLFFGAYWIYKWYGVPEKMIVLGTPYLRLQSVGIFFMFVYLALVGFLRGIKNTRVPMQIFVVGGMIFLLFDYLLIHGKFGFPALKLQGSAVASVIQYSVMCVLALAYLFFDKTTQRYDINLLSGITDLEHIKRIFQLSWPAILDKAIFAAAYIWLGSMVAGMGKYAIASYGVIKDLERFAMLPAVAFAQVITFLVSNAYGQEDWQGIKSNLKKILLLTIVMVMATLFIFSLYPGHIISVFDRKGKFTEFAASLLPYVSLLAFFDVLQVILSGALRGAANVKTVMFVRLAIFIGFFAPVSYLLSLLPIQDDMLKFFLIYGSFYLGNGIMSIIYIQRFRGEQWQGKVT